jgi:hypothetical protein
MNLIFQEATFSMNAKRRGREGVIKKIQHSKKYALTKI